MIELVSLILVYVIIYHIVRMISTFCEVSRAREVSRAIEMTFREHGSSLAMSNEKMPSPARQEANPGVLQTKRELAKVD